MNRFGEQERVCSAARLTITEVTEHASADRRREPTFIAERRLSRIRMRGNFGFEGCRVSVLRMEGLVAARWRFVKKAIWLDVCVASWDNTCCGDARNAASLEGDGER